MEKSIIHYNSFDKLDSFCVLFCSLLSSIFERESLIEENTIINEEIYNRFKMLAQIIEKK